MRLHMLVPSGAGKTYLTERSTHNPWVPGLPGYIVCPTATCKTVLDRTAAYGTRCDPAERDALLRAFLQRPNLGDRGGIYRLAIPQF